VFYTKYFAKKLVVISCKFFFTTKFVCIFYDKIFKTKLTRNISFFISVAHFEKNKKHNALILTIFQVHTEYIILLKRV